MNWVSRLHENQSFLCTGKKLSLLCIKGSFRRRISSTLPRRYSEKNHETVPLTSQKYQITRGNYSKLNKDDLSYFSSILDANCIIGKEDEIQGYTTDWMNKYRGNGSVVLKPRSTKDVSKILKYCNERNIAVVPQGGNTGLVGGSIPIFDEVIVNLANMNNIRQFDEVSGALVCDAGVILENADSYLAERGHIFPLDLGAKGSCHVGGNIATNAGGLRMLRYGSLHGSVLGLEVVLADGSVLRDLRTLRKNNTGYDWKQNFIGSEGTLGIITAVSILCPQRPSAVNVAFLGLSSFTQVKKAYLAAKSHLQEILSAFEFLDDASQKMVHNHTNARFPLDSTYPFYILIETSGSNKKHDDQKLEEYLEYVMSSNIIEDGTVAQDQSQIKSIWAWREGIPEAVHKVGGSTYKYDVSIPLDDIYTLIEDARLRLTKAGVMGSTDDHLVVDCVGFGHLGDGNIHLNVAMRHYDPKVEQLLEPFVFEWIRDHHGSISAEHGLGFAKNRFLSYALDEQKITMMQKIRNLYDPKRILNPYKYV